MADDGFGERADLALAGRGIVKRFGHINALTGASLQVKPGEVVALFGDNGAGKSTLLKVLLGIHRPDAGEVIIDGRSVTMSSIRDAQSHGVEAVHQDLALAPDLSVIDNMFLGHEVCRRGLLGRVGVLARQRMAELTDDALRRLSINLPSLYVPIADLSGGQRQAVAIARAVMWAKTAVLLDEPTAALGARQSEIVCELLRSVADQGLGVLVISHDLPRILRVADRVAILWRGSTTAQQPAGNLTVPGVVAQMVGYQADAA
jgi:simple sugar transport system ATP-binding protein